jgi:hypothetical protein
MNTLTARNVLEDDASLDVKSLFARLHGLITYGSPLETYARTWPAIIQLNKKCRLHENFQWINLYDPTDIIAPKVVSVRSAQEDRNFTLQPINIAVDSSYLIGRSHINYFALPTNKRPHRIVIPLLEWMISGNLPDNISLGPDTTFWR